MFGKFRKIKLRTFLMICSNVISVVLIVVFSILLYSSTSAYIYETADSVNSSEFEYILSNIERNYSDIISIANYIKNNDNIKEHIEVFNNGQAAINDRIGALEHINQFLIGLKNNNKYIKSINIIIECKNSRTISRFYTLDYLISINESRKLIQERIEGLHFCYPNRSYMPRAKAFRDNYLIEDIDNEVYFKFSLFDEQSNSPYSKQYYGNVYILLDYDFFEKITGSRENLLIAEGNKVLYNTMKESSLSSNIFNTIKNSGFESLKGLKDRSLYVKTINNGWTVLCLFDQYGIDTEQAELKTMIISAIAASFLCSFFLSTSLSKKILKPVNSLIEFMLGYHYQQEKYNQYEMETPKSRASLRGRIFYYFLITIILPIFLFLIVFNFQTLYLSTQQTFARFEHTFDKTARYVEEYFNKKLIVFQSIVYDVTMQEFIFTQQDNIDKGLSLFHDSEAVAEVLRNYKYLGLEDDEIRFYDENGLIFSNYISSYKENNMIDLQQLYNIKKGYYWADSKNELNAHVLTASTRVTPIAVSGYSNSKSVYAVMIIPVRDVYDIFDNLRVSSYSVFISDNYGRDITRESAPKIFGQQAISKQKDMDIISNQKEVNFDGNKYVAFYRKIEKTPWYLVALCSYKELMQPGISIVLNYIYVLIICLLLVLLLSYIITFLILKPINKLNIVFEDYNIDNIDPDILEGSYIDEIESLGIAFKKMIERIEDLFDDLLIANMEKNQLQLQIKSAEMVALQAQINPHFLYNTLDNLLFLIDNGDKDKARNVVISLNRLFRFGISRKDRIIPIREEIAYAKAYAEIIRIRYGDGIEFKWDIDDSILEYRTLKLILQPIIENAVLHGFKNMQEGRIVWIKCFKDGETIKFIISNNGEKIPEDKLKRIKEDLDSDIVEDRIGIFNVQARIRLQYGKNYGLTIESDKELTTVTIAIPVDREENI